MQQSVQEDLGGACPLCGAAGVVTSQGSFGYLAHCSECFDADPEAPAWAHLTGKDDEADVALQDWLDKAREYAAVDEIPALRPRLTVERVCQPVELVRLLSELASQEREERARTTGWKFSACCLACDLGDLKSDHRLVRIWGPPEDLGPENHLYCTAPVAA